MMHVCVRCALCAGVVTAASAANAEILSISGGGIILDPSDPANADFPLPNQVQAGVVQGVNEKEVVLGETLEIDDLEDLIGTVTLTEGTAVASHLLSFDPMGSGGVSNILITFDEPVLAVIIDDDTLDETHELFGLDELNYPGSVNLYGFEATEDFVVNGNTIIFDSSASSPGDYFRVLTAVPTPGAATLGVCAAAMGLRRRRAVC